MSQRNSVDVISKRIKENIEQNEQIIGCINYGRYGKDWSDFPRTVYEAMARRINAEVTRQVVERKYLVTDYLILGSDEMESIMFRFKLNSFEDFFEKLTNQSSYKPFHWISGKTLHSYWNSGNAKNKKLNVLLTFLNVPVEDWDDWKYTVKNEPSPEAPELSQAHSLIRKYFTGCYFRYYQKSDNSPILVKTPFVIRTDVTNEVIVETKTIGHRYRSSQVSMRDGALYMDCENLDWNEKESFVFNIGYEINPQVIMGVSNTLNRKREALAIRNILVRQPDSFDYASMEGEEIPFNAQLDPASEESILVRFFSNSPNNIIRTRQCYSLNELTEG